MKLVIDIPEYVYYGIKADYAMSEIIESTYSYIANGIPLDVVKAEIVLQTIEKYEERKARNK